MIIFAGQGEAGSVLTFSEYYSQTIN